MSKWKMPEWMEAHAHRFTNTGRKPTREAIEELYNGNSDPRTNLPLSTIEFGVKSQVALLTRLNQDGKLLL